MIVDRVIPARQGSISMVGRNTVVGFMEVIERARRMGVPETAEVIVTDWNGTEYKFTFTWIGEAVVLNDGHVRG